MHNIDKRIFTDTIIERQSQHIKTANKNIVYNGLYWTSKFGGVKGVTARTMILMSPKPRIQSFLLMLFTVIVAYSRWKHL